MASDNLTPLGYLDAFKGPILDRQLWKRPETRMLSGSGPHSFSFPILS